MEAQDIRLLHAGDVFLDTPFPSSSAAESATRRGWVWQTLETLLEEAERRQVHALLLSGNLLDNTYASADTAARLCRLFSEHKDIAIFISAGKRDALGEGNLLSLFTLPDNVRVYKEQSCVFLPLAGTDLFVGGWSFAEGVEQFSPLAGKIEAPEGRAVLCGTATVGACETGASLDLGALALEGVAYVALSGAPFEGFAETSGTVCAYSGSLEATGFADGGRGGANLITLTEDGQVLCERLPLGRGLYATEQVDVSAMTEPAEAIEAVRSVIGEKGYGRGTALCVVYVGHTAPSFTPPSLTDPEPFGLDEILSVDHSLPDKDEAEYARDMSVRGEVVRALSPSLHANAEKTAENAADALRITFSALDNGDSSHI